MIYVFDSSPLIVLFRHYYPERFPSLWEKFDSMISSQQIISVREVSNELEGQEDRLSAWTGNNKEFFCMPTTGELNFVAEIFRIQHFQALIRRKEQLAGKPVADPFVIAKAKVGWHCLVTQENFKENAAKIPNICNHFNIPYVDLETFMKNENWTF